MAITRQDETELITTVYEGTLETPHWTTFLSRLRGRLRADSASLLVARADLLDKAAEGYSTPVVGPTTGSPIIQPQLIDAYRQRPAPFLLIRPDRAYPEDELIDLFPATTTITAQKLKRRLVRVTDGGNTSAWLQVTREAPAFGAADGALLTQLAPHLAIALRTLSTIRRTVARDATATRGLGLAGVGWISLDRRGQVIDWSDKADEILRSVTPQWQTRDGHFRLGLVPADTLIATAFADMEKGKRRPVAIRLSAMPVVDIVMSHPGTSDEATVIVYVRSSVTRNLETDATALMALFALPLFEARFAARLAAGDSIAEAAVALELTLETARNYSKRLYARTGTHGQADLVRVILESIMVFT